MEDTCKSCGAKLSDNGSPTCPKCGTTDPARYHGKAPPPSPKKSSSSHNYSLLFVMIVITGVMAIGGAWGIFLTSNHVSSTTVVSTVTPVSTTSSISGNITNSTPTINATASMNVVTVYMPLFIMVLIGMLLLTQRRR